MIEPGKHKLTEAMEGNAPATLDASNHHQGPPEATGPGSNPGEVAETARRMQESQNKGGAHDADRETHLVQIGRGQQTHG